MRRDRRTKEKPAETHKTTNRAIVRFAKVRSEVADRIHDQEFPAIKAKEVLGHEITIATGGIAVWQFSQRLRFPPRHIPSHNNPGKTGYCADPDGGLPEVVTVRLYRPVTTHLDLSGAQQRHITRPEGTSR
jgi:hypothetical protein